MASVPASEPADSDPASDQQLAAQLAPGRWLLLIYRIPSEPSRLRATVWRRIKSLGAIYVQSSAAALPASTSAERALRKLRSEILDMAGTAMLLSCQVLAGESDIRAQFQHARDDEYEEIVDKCEDFIAGIDKEYRETHFSYAELEENEVDLVKLRTWLQRVQERDVFGAAGLQAAVSALADCEEKLEAYAARVYAEEGEGR
jgi:hypothetical protein